MMSVTGIKTINSPTTPGQNARGKNGASVVRVPESIGTKTSPAANLADEVMSIFPPVASDVGIGGFEPAA